MNDKAALRRAHSHHPRVHDANRYVYPVISRRSGGLSLGVNLNLDKLCNFACPYCQVDRTVPGPPQRIDLAAVEAEVEGLLGTIDENGICRLNRFEGLAPARRRLRDVAISGDGEPTMVPEFAAICRLLNRLQSRHTGRDFKLVLITNATLLDRVKVLEGIEALLERNGEVWAKLDAGTEEWYQRVNISRFPLDRIEANLRAFGARFPFTVQSFFCTLDGQAPPDGELSAYLERLERLQSRDGAVHHVQLYTLARPPARSICGPVSPELLQELKEKVEALGIPATVYGDED